MGAVRHNFDQGHNPGQGREVLMTTVDKLTKSKQRVADHGEVFTPAWMVEDMLNLVKGETERVDARVLEPACGSGNFLVPVLARKLATVEAKHGKSQFELHHYALLAVMCIYGIELLDDNAEECRTNIAELLQAALKLSDDDVLLLAAKNVLDANVVLGDALTMTIPGGSPILFPEWAYLGKGKYQRRDFRFQDLTQRSSFEGTLFGGLSDEELFTPTRTYPQMTMEMIAR